MTATVRFTEEMLGHVTFGESDFARGAQPELDGAERSDAGAGRTLSRPTEDAHVD